MTREHMLATITFRLHTTMVDGLTHPLSASSLSRFGWLVDSLVHPLFQDTTDGLRRQGVVADSVAALDQRFPFTALWVEEPALIVCLWPSETERWLNLRVCSDHNFMQAPVYAISYRSIARGRLAQELDLALLDILPSNFVPLTI